MAATAAGRPTLGAAHLRAGLRALGWSESADAAAPTAPGLAARLLISLAHAEAEQGRTGHGLALLDQAEAFVEPADRGVVLQQRGLLLMRTGRADEAIHLLDVALPLLADPPVLARTLLNRSVLHMAGGRVRLAREDLRRCERVARRHALDLLAAKSVHNGAYCDLLAGDIPAALAAFDAARGTYVRHAPGLLPILTLDKARALLAAGLAADAGRELDAALGLFRAQRLSQDHAEAELTRAQAALDAGDAAGARGWAQRAERRFRRRGNAAWAATAALLRLRASGGGRGATRLAGQLRGLGLAAEAEVAELLAVRALVAAGRTARARRQVAAVRRSPHAAPLELRLLRRLARAELAHAEGRRGETLAQLRAGLAALDDQRSRLGSLDLQISTAALGRELARTGLRTALDAGDPRLVFAWSERTRAQAFRVRPVTAPADPETAEALAELRQLRRTLRVAELDGRPDPATRARCAELERKLRERDWRLPGTGEQHRTASLAAVAAGLGADRAMVVLVRYAGRLLALAIRDGATRAVGLGDTAVVEEAQRRLLGDLNALAGRHLPERLAAVIRESIGRQLAVLTAEVTAPLRPLLGDRDVVVVPTMSMSGMPWGLLPDLRGRAVTVAPSASAWLTARRNADAAPVTDRPPLVVAGPDLAHADAEVREIAAVYPGATALTGAGASVDAALRGLAGAPTVHLAAHGHHDRDNVLFSRLDLADGPLMAYDVQRLARPPRHVVLSACDVGQAVVRPGDEILGFTAALLYAGTPTVVASVARVPDDAAAAVMVAYHRAVAAGVGPARALAAASLAEPLASFLCFGAG